MLKALLIMLFAANVFAGHKSGRHCPSVQTVTTTFYSPCPTCPPSPTTVTVTVTAGCASSSSSSSSTSVAPTPTPFTVIAARSGSPIHLQEIQASGQLFWIGQGPSTFCPVPTVPADQCPAGTSTVFIANGGGLSLDVEVPGGQLVYVETDGALGFTQAHSAFIPAGAVVSTFTLIPGTSFGTLGFSGLGANGFVACPSANGSAPYQIFANVAAGDFTNCLGFDALTTEFTGGFGAWQYT